MSETNEVFFGNKNTFAIRCVPGFPDSSNDYHACFHLVLRDQIIGDKTEPCNTNEWKAYVRTLKDRIKNDFQSIQHNEFTDKADEELFGLIWKSNQIEDEFKPEFNQLPVLDNKVWRNCTISIDETTDSYLITISEMNGAIKFLWKGLRYPCPADKIGKLFTITVDRDFFIETCESFLAR